MGIRITAVGPDWSYVEARLKRRWWNQNYIGTIFGGALYALCDPYPLVMLIHRLGPAYIVRDKGAEVRFLKKGTDVAWVRAELPEAVVEEIRRVPQVVQERRFLLQVKDAEGVVLSEVVKILHIRRII